MSKDDDNCENNLCYDDLKQEVLRGLRRKIDKENYKYQIKQCRDVAVSAQEEGFIGQSRRPLKNAWKKVRNS